MYGKMCPMYQRLPLDRPGAIFDGTRKFQKGVLLSYEFSGGAHFALPLYMHYMQICIGLSTYIFGFLWKFLLFYTKKDILTFTEVFFMSLAHARLAAQKRMLENRGRMTAVWLFGAAARLVLLSGLGISVYMLATLSGFTEPGQNPYLTAALYALFALGVLLSSALFALVSFCTARWFYRNAVHAQSFAAFFDRLTLRDTVKLVYFFWLRRLLGVLHFVGYLFPFFIGAGALWLTLRARGMTPFLFYAVCVLLAAFLITGTYFGFAAVQKYAFCEALLTLDPARGVVDTLRESRRLSRGLCFACARERLRFSLWALLCVLIFPLLYVAPYYRQSMACMAKLVLDKNHLTPQSQKPIVFLRLAKSPA